MKRALLASILFTLASVIGYGLATSSPGNKEDDPGFVLFSSAMNRF